MLLRRGEWILNAPVANNGENLPASGQGKSESQSI